MDMKCTKSVTTMASWDHQTETKTIITSNVVQEFSSSSQFLFSKGPPWLCWILIDDTTAATVVGMYIFRKRGK
jgi:hypothetical protein